MLRHAALTLVVGLSASARADDVRPCANALSQQDMNICIGQAVDDADETLNRVYKALSAKLDPNGRRNLIAAERAWVVFRDRECDLRSGYDRQIPENNGTIAPFLVGACKLDLTKLREADLRDQLKCPGGDLSCPQ